MIRRARDSGRPFLHNPVVAAGCVCYYELLLDSY